MSRICVTNLINTALKGCIYFAEHGLSHCICNICNMKYLVYLERRVFDLLPLLCLQVEPATNFQLCMQKQQGSVCPVSVNHSQTQSPSSTRSHREDCLPLTSYSRLPWKLWIQAVGRNPADHFLGNSPVLLWSQAMNPVLFDLLTLQER